MFFATDSNGNRVSITEAVSTNEYFCPVCKTKLFIKDGLINAKHFYHSKHECLDDWNYDMSEWHRHKQSFFNPDSCEVVVEYNGEMHRADVLINRTVIEFQHSSITAEEFERRTRFFIDAGYRIAWVFDVTDQFKSEAIGFLNEDRDDLYIWKHPIRIFAKCPTITDQSKSFSLWLTWDTEGNFDILNKVIWATRDDNNEYVLKRFAVSPYLIDMNKEVDIDDFFKSQKDYLSDEIKNLKSQYSYSVKYIGEKGHERAAYICPKRNEFGLKVWSEKGCAYCRYCYMIAEKKRKDEIKWAVYCCYPNQVRELTDARLDYECCQVQFYSL